MISKRCSKCNKRSFGSKIEKWICPYCGKDISRVKSIKVGDPLKIIKRKR